MTANSMCWGEGMAADAQSLIVNPANTPCCLFLSLAESVPSALILTQAQILLAQIREIIRSEVPDYSTWPFGEWHSRSPGDSPL